jgi:HB1, ASXL, restriction endonuclease HTH domain
MTYYEAALQVLRSTQRPLTTREVTEHAIRSGLITPRGKTPNQSMTRMLYLAARHDPELVKLED